MTGDPCELVAAYGPLGDTEWFCTTHGEIAVLREPHRTLTNDWEQYRPDEFECLSPTRRKDGRWTT